jgi:hypothetical protein
MKEPGIGCVGIIIRHGIFVDRQTFAPVLDLSVCWLSSETSLEIAEATMHLNSNKGTRWLKMRCDEYALLPN